LDKLLEGRGIHAEPLHKVTSSAMDEKTSLVGFEVAIVAVCHTLLPHRLHRQPDAIAHAINAIGVHNPNVKKINSP
jgi:hypothetical protein